MGWRTVVIKERAQLSHKLEYLTIKHATCSERVYLDEIDCLMIESCSTFLNSGLTNELARRKIAVVFCDKNHNPASQLLPLNGAFDARRKMIDQIGWNDDTKQELWTKIVQHKILRQADVLKFLEIDAHQVNKLQTMAQNVQFNDTANCEAQAARLYFATIFGLEFNRRDMQWEENAALNYGYAILLSNFNRAVVANGYLTQLGIHHIGNENAFNLSCDLMEPFRPIVDWWLIDNHLWELTPDYKHQLVDVLNFSVLINGEKQYLSNAITMYCKDCLDAITAGDVTDFSSYEFDKSPF